MQSKEKKIKKILSLFKGDPQPKEPNLRVWRCWGGEKVLVSEAPLGVMGEADINIICECDNREELTEPL